MALTPADVEQFAACWRRLNQLHERLYDLGEAARIEPPRPDVLGLRVLIETLEQQINLLEVAVCRAFHSRSRSRSL